MEHSDEYNWAVRNVIKRQLRDLLQQLHERGDEIAVLALNTDDGACSNFGSTIGEGFMSAQKTLMPSFLKYCRDTKKKPGAQKEVPATPTMTVHTPTVRTPATLLSQSPCGSTNTLLHMPIIPYRPMSGVTENYAVASMEKSNDAAGAGKAVLRIKIPKAIAAGTRDLPGLVGDLVSAQLSGKKWRELQNRSDGKAKETERKRAIVDSPTEAVSKRTRTAVSKETNSPEETKVSPPKKPDSTPSKETPDTPMTRARRSTRKMPARYLEGMQQSQKTKKTSKMDDAVDDTEDTSVTTATAAAGDSMDISAEKTSSKSATSQAEMEQDKLSHADDTSGTTATEVTGQGLTDIMRQVNLATVGRDLGNKEIRGQLVGKYSGQKHTMNYRITARRPHNVLDISVDIPSLPEPTEDTNQTVVTSNTVDIPPDELHHLSSTIQLFMALDAKQATISDDSAMNSTSEFNDTIDDTSVYDHDDTEERDRHRGHPNVNIVLNDDDEADGTWEHRMITKGSVKYGTWKHTVVNKGSTKDGRMEHTFIKKGIRDAKRRRRKKIIKKDLTLARDNLDSEIDITTGQDDIYIDHAEDDTTEQGFVKQINASDDTRHPTVRTDNKASGTREQMYKVIRKDGSKAVTAASTGSKKAQTPVKYDGGKHKKDNLETIYKVPDGTGKVFSVHKFSTKDGAQRQTPIEKDWAKDGNRLEIIVNKDGTTQQTVKKGTTKHTTAETSIVNKVGTRRDTVKKGTTKHTTAETSVVNKDGTTQATVKKGTTKHTTAETSVDQRVVLDVIKELEYLRKKAEAINITGSNRSSAFDALCKAVGIGEDGVLKENYEIQNVDSDTDNDNGDDHFDGTDNDITVDGFDDIKTPVPSVSNHGNRGVEKTQKGKKKVTSPEKVFVYKSGEGLVSLLDKNKYAFKCKYCSKITIELTHQKFCEKNPNRAVKVTLDSGTKTTVGGNADTGLIKDATTATASDVVDTDTSKGTMENIDSYKAKSYVNTDVTNNTETEKGENDNVEEEKGGTYKAVEILTDANREFSCFLCLKIFPTYSGLRLHVTSNACMATSDNKSISTKPKEKSLITTLRQRYKMQKCPSMTNTYVCEFCGSKLKGSGNYFNHIRIVHENYRPYSCDVCRKSFYSRNQMDNHKISVHMRKCNKCQTYIAEVEPFTEDVNRHVVRDVICGHCGEVVIFTSRSTIGKRPPPKKPRQPKTSNNCRRKTTALGAVASGEGEAKVFGDSTKDASDTDTDHAVTNADVPNRAELYNAATIDGSEATLGYSDTGVNSTNMGAATNVTDGQNGAALYERNEKYIRIPVGQPNEGEFAFTRYPIKHRGNSQKPVEKTYACEVCGKLFGTTSGCRRHRQVHATEHAFICDICGKQFKHECSLGSHRKNHTSTQPKYMCFMCHKEFVTKWAYKLHMEKNHQMDMNTIPLDQQRAPVNKNVEVEPVYMFENSTTKSSSGDVSTFTKEDTQIPETVTTADINLLGVSTVDYQQAGNIFTDAIYTHGTILSDTVCIETETDTTHIECPEFVIPSSVG